MGTDYKKKINSFRNIKTRWDKNADYMQDRRG